MSDAPPDQSLHLPSLVIKNFRGIDELTIPRLGRVTLLAGKNGVGKTTVLDAVRIWSARARTRVLSDVLFDRDEVVSAVEDDGTETVVANLNALFSGRRMDDERTISIGSSPTSHVLCMGVVPLKDDDVDQLDLYSGEIFSDERLLGVRIYFGETGYTIPSRSLHHIGQARVRSQALPRILRLRRIPELADPIVCHIWGPDVPSNAAIEEHYSDAALTDDEERAIEALNIVAADTVERVAAVGSNALSGGITGRRILVKIAGEEDRVPLRSLGDGAVRTFAIALALASSRNGFLLIDEVENGIHHSVQPKFWEMVLKTAQRNNVQVLATTHSSDCAYRFGQVASQLPDIEGILYRIQRNVDRLRAVPYPEDQLVIAAEHRIEVR